MPPADGNFDEQLPHEMRPRGPGGDTHGELTPPVRSPREQQVRHVGACHEQNVAAQHRHVATVALFPQRIAQRQARSHFARLQLSSCAATAPKTERRKRSRSAVERDRPNRLSARHERRRTQPRVLTISRWFEEARDGVIDNLGVSNRAHVAHPVELDDLYFRKRSYEKPSDTSRR